MALALVEIRVRPKRLVGAFSVFSNECYALGDDCWMFVEDVLEFVWDLFWICWALVGILFVQVERSGKNIVLSNLHFV